MKPKNTLKTTPIIHCENCIYFYYHETMKGKESIAVDAKEIESCNGECKFKPESISKNGKDFCGQAIEYK